MRRTSQNSPIVIEGLDRPWEQLIPDESERAYLAFRCFQDADPANRTVEVAYQKWAELTNKTAKRSPGYFRDWCSRFRWVERVALYQRWFDRRRLEAESDRLIQERKIWAERKLEVARKSWDVADLLDTKAREILKHSTIERKIENRRQQIDPETGQLISIIEEITLKPVNFNFGHAQILMREADRQRRMATGSATEIFIIETPGEKAERQILEARQALQESRERFPSIDETQRLQLIANAYEVSTDDLIQDLEAIPPATSVFTQ